MEENEKSVYFYADKEVLEAFDAASKKKGKDLGIPLNKKQAYNLALKEITKKWMAE